MNRPVSRPVEYAVAVDRFLSGTSLSEGSRRVYRIALATWAWTWVDRVPPTGPGRRCATPPAVPLALLDTPRVADLLRAAFTARSTDVGARTANRELSILGSAVSWWLARDWLATDPTAGLHRLPLPGQRAARSGPDIAETVLRLPAPLREQTFWHLLYESGAPIDRVLALDVDDLDLPGRRSRNQHGTPLVWADGAARLLPLLTVGRLEGPLFATGRGRLSYRRAAELFTATTRPLDPRGSGWTLRQLQSARR